MPVKPLFYVALAVALFGAAREARAQYYNDDFITLPNGPIELENATASYDSTLKQWTLSGDAVNLTSQTYSDVKYLDEWVFDTTPLAFTYQGSDLWTATDGNSWSIVSPDGFLEANDVSPLPTTDTPQAFTAPPGSVAPTDMLPYTIIGTGTVGPYASVPFSFKVDVNTNFNFAFDSSFVSTTEPVFTPEPSSLALICIGGIGAMGLLVCRRRRLATVRA